MAAPQFFVPPRVKPSRSKRRFTLVQANATLPLVTRIVADIVRVHKDFSDQQEQIEQSSKVRTDAEKRLESTRERLVGLVEELHVVGAELKDAEIGLIDFIGRHQGRDVYLCWKLGESKIAHWHETDAGVKGRQPISTLNENEKAS